MSFCLRHTFLRNTERLYRYLGLRGMGKASAKAGDTAGEHTTETVGVEAATEHL